MPIDLFDLQSDMPPELLAAANSTTADGSFVTLTVAKDVKPRFYPGDAAALHHRHRSVGRSDRGGSDGANRHWRRPSEEKQAARADGGGTRREEAA